MNNETEERQMEAIAAELRSEVARQQLTYKVVAERAGMQQMTVSRYMRGERDIPMSKLFAMCRALGITAGDLLARAVEQ